MAQGYARNYRGRPVFKLEKKLEVMRRVLFAAGHLDADSMRSLARGAGLNMATFTHAALVGRVTPPVEEKICNLGGFDPTELAWRDPRVSDEDRQIGNRNYTGEDTPEAFLILLQRIWKIGARRFRAVGDRPTSVNADLACHELSDSGQGTSADSDLALFLEADIGTLNDAPNALRYGFLRARLRVDLACAYGSRTKLRLARDRDIVLNGTKLTARGTSSRPSWEIECAVDQEGLLDGTIITSEEPLLSIESFGSGTRVSSVLSVNLADARVIPTDGARPISGNKAAVIQRICALLMLQEVDELGRADLSFHSLQLQEGD